MRAEFKTSKKPDVVLTLTYEEAETLRAVLMYDVEWAETRREGFYSRLNGVLKDLLDEEDL